MPLLGFRIPAREAGWFDFVAIDEDGEWIGHERGFAADAAAVFARFATLGPPEEKRCCEAQLIEAARASGWTPTPRGLQRWKRLARFALETDPENAQRVPLALFGELFDRCATYQRLDSSRYRAGTRLELHSGLSERDDHYSAGDARFEFSGRRRNEANALHLHYAPRDLPARTISMSFTPTVPEDPLVCAGLHPRIWTSSGRGDALAPTATDLLVFIAHLDVLLNVRSRAIGAASTIGYGATYVTAQAWESLPR